MGSTGSAGHLVCWVEHERMIADLTWSSRDIMIMHQSGGGSSGFDLDTGDTCLDVWSYGDRGRIRGRTTRGGFASLSGMMLYKCFRLFS